MPGRFETNVVVSVAAAAIRHILCLVADQVLEGADVSVLTGVASDKIKVVAGDEASFFAGVDRNDMSADTPKT